MARSESKGKQAVQAPATITDDARRLFDRVVEEALHNDRELFDSLSQHEQKLVIQWLAEAVVTGDGDNVLSTALWELDYIRRPATIEQFIEDDYYMGKVGRDLHPNWKRDLKAVFAPGSQIAEWVMTGAIGTGKTTLAMLAMAFKLHCLSCLRDPSRYYGLLADSTIVFSIFSITKRQVADAGYSKLRGYIDASPYFRFDFPRSTKIDSQLDFSRSTGTPIKVIAGSQNMHALGLDVFSFAMDEVNFMRAKMDAEASMMTGQAYEIYNAVHSRILSRFLRPGGSLPGIMLLMSSRNAQTSFLEEHLKKVKNEPTTYISDYALWDVKDPSKFSKKKFRVEVGDRTAQSRILLPGDEGRPGAQIVEVPETFRQTFIQDTDQALRDHAGVATYNVSPLIRDRASVVDARRTELQCPFKTEVVSVSTDRDDLLDDYFVVDKACRIVNGKWRPKINPSAPRFMHLDLALTGDRAGIAMGHVSGLVRREKVQADGVVSLVEEPFIVIDLMLAVAPPETGEIDFSKLRTFVGYLRKMYNIVKVTADGFQSADMIQILKKMGVAAMVLSVDRTENPYLSLRSALSDRRIAYYQHHRFETEILDLIRDIKTGKIDHPVKASDGTRGSKDVADAVAATVWHCVSDEMATRDVPILLGAESVENMSQAVLPTAPRSDGKVLDPKQLSQETVEARVIGGKTVAWSELEANAS